MKKQWKIYLIVILLIFAGHTVFAQSNTGQVDSVKLTHKKTESSVSVKDKNATDDLNKQKENSQNTNGIQAIKQVNGARPDMSKSRAARPPYIERQAGSGIPKGIGKPGGAFKPGKR